MSAPLPVFGPTGEPFGHEDDDHQLIVRVAYKLSREQVTAALRVSFAQLGGERAPADMTVDEIRTEVEEFFASAGILDCDDALDRQALRGQSGDALAEAAARAYWAPAPVRPMPGPRYLDGEVLLSTIDHGTVVVDEPAWCVGHAWQQGIGRNDITHNATTTKVDVSTEHGRTNVLTARISWAPFIEAAPVVSVALDPDSTQGDYQAEEIGPLAEGLRKAADVLERLAADALRLREAL